MTVIIPIVRMRKVGGREAAPSTGCALPPLMLLLVAEDKIPVSTVRAVRAGHDWLGWDTQLLPAHGNLHRRVNRIPLYLDKMTELNKWRGDTELRRPGCSQSRSCFSRVRRGGRQ